MKLHEARAIADEVMSSQGLTQEGWTFSFDTARARFGQCNHSLRRITISRSLTELNDEEAVRDTITSYSRPFYQDTPENREIAQKIITRSEALAAHIENEEGEIEALEKKLKEAGPTIPAAELPEWDK